MPHNSDKENVTSPAIDINQAFELTLLARPGAIIAEEALHAVRIWLLLGGLGKRSRRMFGALDVVDWDPRFWFNYAKPTTAMEYASLVKICLDKATHPMAAYGKLLPEFPTLHKQFSQVFISDDDRVQDDSENAMSYLFKQHLRNSEKPFAKNYDVFGYAGRDNYGETNRRASPVIVQLRALEHAHGISLHPIVTAMCSEFDTPPGRNMNWDLFKQFLSEYKAALQCVPAWGDYG